jgi:hypothetical protein
MGRDEFIIIKSDKLLIIITENGTFGEVLADLQNCGFMDNFVAFYKIMAF